MNNKQLIINMQKIQLYYVNKYERLQHKEYLGEALLQS